MVEQARTTGTYDNYGSLPDVYEWLVGDAISTPTGAVSGRQHLLDGLPEHARVLDCACGTGQLAVGLAEQGLHVVASDASPGMIRRTRALAEEHGVDLTTVRSRWDELPDRLAGSTFDAVICVGNSLGHAEGADGRTTALRSMAAMLAPGGRLVITSRSWEWVRARGTRTEVRDQVVRRRGRDAVVVYRWEIARGWNEEHHVEITVARLADDGRIDSRSERLSLWPYPYAELVDQLREVGLRVELSTFEEGCEGYDVVAVK